MQLEPLESRRLLAATPLGVTPMDTGEFLLGTVAVTPVLFESNGAIDPQSQNWTAGEIDQLLAKVDEGVNWWRDTLETLDTVHSLEFVIDDTFAIDPVETPYEPIDRSSSAFNQYVGDFMTSQGYGDANTIEEAVRQFNHAQRTKLGTDWAFTIFVIDSSEDPDGLFASGGSFAAAFAYAGGLFLVTPSTRPASTITHEMGHIFWARDEYSGGGSWTDQRGYYDTQNLNAADNPASGFQQEISIMRGGVPLTAAFDAHVSPESTLAMVGWQDSDGDGIFDLADVPLDLDAVGYFDSVHSLYHLSGTASAVPLRNQNSSGPQSDITLNRISQLQYSLDDGPWLDAAPFDQQQVVQFDISLQMGQPFSTIRWRAIDQSTGVVSPIVTGTSTAPALSASSVSGFAFIDADLDGQRGEGESVLENTEVIIRAADGSPLFGGEVNAADFPDGGLPGNLSGVTIAADGIVSDSQVGSFVSEIAGNARVFQAFDQQRGRWVDRWSSKVALEASFEHAVGEVRLDAIGLDEVSFVRVEAYDAAGQWLGRVTTDAIATGETATIEITDPLGRIASIRAFGHADTSVALSNLRFGAEDRVVTDHSGGWKLQNLPDGNYRLELVPQRPIYQFASATIEVQVVAGASEFMLAAAKRVNSPRYNEAIPEDVNQDGVITARDALAIINDLSRFDSRILQANDDAGFDVDVSNDGGVSALDALLVINYLGRENGGSGENVSAPTGSRAPQVAQMFNSAGDATLDESADPPSADTTDQPIVGERRLASKIQNFALNSESGLAESTSKDDETPKNAEDPDKLIVPIPPENSEPFGHAEV